jgi:hypothetical protein
MNLASTLSIYGGGPGSGCEGPNCGRPKTKLQEMLEQIRDQHIWDEKNLWVKLAKYGHPGNTEPFTAEEKKELVPIRKSGRQCNLGECYMNAQRIAVDYLDNPKVQYVEGLVSVHGVPLDHAWIEYNGKVFDPTLYDKQGNSKQSIEHEYFGVTIPKDEIMSHQLKTKVYSPLSSDWRDPEMMDKIWKSQSK